MVKWVQTVIEDYEGPKDYKTFRKYLEDMLREKLRRIEGLLVEIGCRYP
ncbi:MAG: hypothetical protein QXI36_01690 [Candidatus Bathyarchaeia archaeon]